MLACSAFLWKDNEAYPLIHKGRLTFHIFPDSGKTHKGIQLEKGKQWGQGAKQKGWGWERKNTGSIEPSGGERAGHEGRGNGGHKVVLKSVPSVF